MDEKCFKKMNDEIERLAGEWNKCKIKYHSELLEKVYLAGCKAQAETDKVAVGQCDVYGLNSDEVLIELKETLAALAAAEIKEVK